MNYLNKLIFFSFFFFPLDSLGQDTLCFCRTPWGWVSECYWFIKESKNSKEGFFIKKMGSDDGQSWSGRGNFKEYKNNIKLDSSILIRTFIQYGPRKAGSMDNKIVIKDSSVIPQEIFIKKKDKFGMIYLEFYSEAQKIKMKYSQKIKGKSAKKIMRITQ